MGRGVGRIKAVEHQAARLEALVVATGAVFADYSGVGGALEQAEPRDEVRSGEQSNGGSPDAIYGFAAAWLLPKTPLNRSAAGVSWKPSGIWKTLSGTGADESSTAS